MWELARPNIFFLLRGERKDKRIRCYPARRIVVSVTDKDEGRNNSAEEASSTFLNRDIHIPHNSIRRDRCRRS